MADYWKSQPRKFCQYCKCWIADNKPSIEFHERGKNHKENVAAKISEIKKKSMEKAKQEKKMCKQFAAMEEAAMKAYEEDLKRIERESQGSSRLAPQAPPPQPSAPPPRSRKQEVEAEEAEPSVWLEGFSEQGHVYYYNTQTGESRWDKPDAALRGSGPSPDAQGSWFSVWTEAVSPDGFLYYYNTQTGESSWDKPTDFPRVEEPPAPGTIPSAADGTLGDPDHPNQEVTVSFRKRKAEDDELACRDNKETGAEPEKSEEEKVEEDQKMEKEEEEKMEEEEKKEEEKEEEKTEVKIQVKRSRKFTPYGAWEKIKEEKDPYANVDLQLPQFEEFPSSIPAELPPEPKPKFKERVITSLGDDGGGATTFRRNKKNRNLRQRDSR